MGAGSSWNIAGFFVRGGDSLYRVTHKGWDFNDNLKLINDNWTLNCNKAFNQSVKWFAKKNF